jgi:hypothetical protein
MINKDKTIQKAFQKYNEIYPVGGKKSLDDCFFCLHGQIVFQFQTKDRKNHFIRAIEQSHSIVINKNTLWGKLYKFFSQPITVPAVSGRPKMHGASI